MSKSSSRERIYRAMTLQETDKIPVMSQLSIGHILLQTGVDPVEFNFTNKGYANSLLEMRRRYDFDGILIHKPGREEKVLEITRREEIEAGVQLVFADAGIIFCPFDDDPKYIPPPGYQKPSISSFNPSKIWDDVPDSIRHWWLNCGLVELDSLEDIPEFWFACIDQVKVEAQGEYSIHGEVNSPFDSIFHLLDFEDVLMGILTHPKVIHQTLEVLTHVSLLWAVAQIRRGTDAIKLSSPWAGSGFISRQHYKEFVLPYESRIVQGIREEGGVVYTHTCGAISDRLDLIVASGVHGIECLDPPPLGDMELNQAVADWGEQIFIKGNVDSVNMLLVEKPEQVFADAAQRVAIGARGKGFILSSACSIAPRVPAHNVLAMVQAARCFERDLADLK
jgi:uroporphyrinogen-III decarboxylase